MKKFLLIILCVAAAQASVAGSRSMGCSEPCQAMSNDHQVVMKGANIIDITVTDASTSCRSETSSRVEPLGHGGIVNRPIDPRRHRSEVTDAMDDSESDGTTLHTAIVDADAVNPGLVVNPGVGLADEPLGHGGIIVRPIDPRPIRPGTVKSGMANAQPGPSSPSPEAAMTATGQGDAAVEATAATGLDRMCGDVDCDGRVNISDVTALIDNLLNGVAAGADDVNQDGSMSIADVTVLIDALLAGSAK